MMTQFIRLLVWRHRLRKAQWDVAYYRSAVAHYGAELRKAKTRLTDVERARVEVDFPAPPGVAR
jgi:hypothetical protein